MPVPEALVARILAGVPLDAAEIEAVPEPFRSIARRVVGANGNGPHEFDKVLNELLPEVERAQFKQAVFSVDPYSGTCITGLSEAAAVYAAQFKKLADALAPRPRLPNIVEGILQPRSLSIWYGSPGSLKSNLLLDLCFSVAMGRPWLPDLPGAGPRRGFAVKPSPALWIDSDNGVEVLTERLAAFARGYQAPEDTPIYWLTFPNPPIAAAKGLPGLTDYALSVRAGVIVIDNLLRVAGVRDENSSEIDAAMLSLRKLAEVSGAAVCLIHHKRKDSLGREGDSLRGHSSIEGGVDSALLIKREDGSSAVIVKPTKSRRKPPETFGALWTFELADDGQSLHEARFWRSDPKDPEAEASAEVRRRILEALKNGPINQGELAAVVGGAKARVIAEANALIMEGAVKRNKGKNNATIYQLL